MAKTLVDFIEELDTNASLREEYLKDPVGTAKRNGLSDEDINTIKNKDWETVSKQFEDLSKSSKNIDHNM
ncbi:MAG: hypothetical protein ACFHVJ_05410 [Aestuariibacter sp.]